MKGLILFAFLFTYTVNALHATTAPCDTLHLYFDIDDYKLTDHHKSQLKALTDSLRETQTITVIGYCDYLGTSSYNQPLSEKRANEVKDLILSTGPNLSVIAQGKGQIPEAGTKSRSGEPYSRRVDVIFIKSKPRKPIRVSARFAKKIDSLAARGVGTSWPLDELTFLPGRHILRNEVKPLLMQLTQYLLDHPNIVFEIRGHVCCEENGDDSIDIDQHTRNLSINRAREIYYYFFENGIAKRRMTCTGVGSSQPRVYPESSAEAQQLNRRVEIIILKK